MTTWAALLTLDQTSIPASAGIPGLRWQQAIEEILILDTPLRYREVKVTESENRQRGFQDYPVTRSVGFLKMSTRALSGGTQVAGTPGFWESKLTMVNTKHKQLEALRLTDPLYGLTGGKDKGGVKAPADPYACLTHPFLSRDTLENDEVRACPARR